MSLQVLCGTSDQCSEFAAAHISAAVNRVTTRRRFGLGVATGSSPIKLYGGLKNLVVAGGLSFVSVVTFPLDEYIGLPIGHPQSYAEFLNDHLWNPCEVPQSGRNIPDPNDPAAYDRLIRAFDGGGIDLQILGLGSDAHIGFNEPGTPFDSRTHIVDLHPDTIRDNARFFDGEESMVPRRAVTQGIGTILEAGEIILLAFGQAKAEAVRKMLEGPIGVDCPASALRNFRNPATILLDPEAASLLGSTPIGMLTA